MTDASREVLGLGVVCVAVLRAAATFVVGVLDWDTGVFARVVGVLCCLDTLALVGSRFDPAGEFDRVEAGLAGLGVEVSFLTEIGNRDGDDA